MMMKVLLIFFTVWFHVSNSEEKITRSYHEMKEKASYDEVKCGVCKGLKKESQSQQTHLHYNLFW